MINTLNTISGLLGTYIQTEIKDRKLTEDTTMGILAALKTYGDPQDIRFTKFLITQNDKDFFGIRVEYVTPRSSWFSMIQYEQPALPPEMIAVELDSRMLSGLFTADEIATLIMAELDTAMSSVPASSSVDVYYGVVTAYDMIMNPKNMSKYKGLFNFIMAEVTYMVTSYTFKAINENDVDVTTITCPFAEDPSMDPYIVECFNSAIAKVKAQSMNLNIVAPKTQAAMLIRWFFSVTAEEVIDNNIGIIKTIMRSSELASSALYRDRCETANRDLRSVMQINRQPEVMGEGVFTNMKLNGLRSIETDLYEFRIRVRNAATQDEALLLMRQLNNNMCVIDSYIMDNMGTLSTKDIEHWRGVYNNYSELREDLSKKAVYDRHMYGLFVDYSTLQQIGNSALTGGY